MTIPPTTNTPSTPRSFDMYRAAHKGIRLLLGNLLLQMGSASFDDPTDRDRICEALERVLTSCDAHVRHEDAHIRPALESRAPSAVAPLDAEHALHAVEVAELRSLARALGAAPSAEAQRSTGHTLYLHFSAFVAESLAHMAHEERVVQPLLDRLFRVEELHAIHCGLVQAIPPREMLAFLRVMIPAVNREERAALVDQVRQGVPDEVYRALLRDLAPDLALTEGDPLVPRLSRGSYDELACDLAR